CFELLQSLEGFTKTNILFSPYSVSTAMGMIYVGARGETQRELYHAAHTKDGADGGDSDRVLQAYADHAEQLQVGQSQSTFDVANAVAIQERLSLLSAYESTLDSTFHAQLLKVDFVNGGQAAINEINRWVKQKTDDKIDKPFDGPLDPDTRLVLLNAIVSKGVWSTKFDKSATTKNKFLNGGTTLTQVDTMTKSIRIGCKPFPTIRLEVAELPYAGGNYNMVILLPRGNEGIEGFKHSLAETYLQDIIGHVEPRKVTVSLPKFKLEAEYSLKDNLNNLGITEMFSAQADLSGITSDADLTVSDVVHKAVVEVNEEGTEAAAATGVVAVNRLSGVPSLEFNVNQPFLFFIRNTQTQDLLFAGQLNHL
ncbi:unnamed protein product, partial [Ixodes persulcatus]